MNDRPTSNRTASDPTGHADHGISRSIWTVQRSEARGRHGAIAAKHELGAQAGIDILREGGSAVDAAVAAAFTLAVVEPFMSGLGGGGFMVVHDARHGRQEVIDFAMAAPAAARPDMFELIPDGGKTGFFGWDAVVGDANIVGHRAVAVPGAVAGLLLAHERHGVLPLPALLEQAIAWADDGFEVDWFTSYMTGLSMAELARFAESAAIFLPHGRPPLPALGEPGERLVQKDLAATLRAIAAGGKDAFYAGPIAAAIADDMSANGGLVTADDLAAYRPRIHPNGLVGHYRGHTLVGVPAPSGSPTVLEILALLDRFDVGALGHNSAAALHLFAEAGLAAFDDRFEWLADPTAGDGSSSGTDVVERLLGDAHLSRIAARIDPHGARSPGRAAGAASDDRERTTTTLAVVDGDGNAVALTTTLLSGFGSAVIAPGTGVLLNNGMMWFDPRPGRPNSAGPGKRPLNNMSPMLVLRDGRPRLVVGAMGGRRIISAVATIVSNVLDFGLGMQAACEAPRLDLSTGQVLADPRLASAAVDELRRRGHDVQIKPDVFGAFEYGSPAAILVDDGQLCTGIDALNPAAAAAF